MNSTEPMPHAEASELLPWLANGTLAGAERDRVDAHAQACVICRRDLEELGRLAAAISREATATPVPAPDMRRINARIDARLENESGAARLFGTVRSWLQSPWRVAVAAQSIAIVVLVAVLAWPGPERAGFTTLATPESLPPGHYVRVVFDPALDEAAVSAIVESLGLTLVAGPSERGVATLATPAPAGTVLLSELLEQPGVLFAQPIARGDP
ncbi:MAG: zf-HC2 domain-containing protein [Woeseiaceae bacterium]|nr:zf-HC2 domain-containing protein [Woeseiaceae bacterium]